MSNLSSPPHPNSKSQYLNEEIRFKGNYSQDVIKTLRMIFEKYLWQFLLIFSIGFVGRMLIMGGNLVMGYWIDSVCNRSSHFCRKLPTLMQNFDSSTFLITLCIMFIGGCLGTLWFRVSLARSSSLAVSQFYDEVTLRVSRFPMSFLDRTPVGRMMARFSSDYGNIYRVFGGPIAEFAVLGLDLLAIVVLVLWQAPSFIPIVFVSFLCQGFIYTRYANRLRQERRESSALRGPSLAHFSESVQGATTIRAFARQKSFFERFSRLERSFLQQKFKAAAYLQTLTFKMAAANIIFVLSTTCWGWFLLQKGWSSAGIVASMMSFVAISGTTTQLFFEWFINLDEALTGVERLDDYLRRPVEPGALLPPQAKYQTGHPTETLAQSESRKQKKHPLLQLENAGLKIHNLHFRYGDNLPWVLKGIKFEIEAGEHVGLVGQTGCGKSTLVQLLYYLYAPQLGYVQVDQYYPLGPLENLKMTSHLPLTNHAPLGAQGVALAVFRQAFSLIPQEAVIFKGTLRDNIQMLAHQKDDFLEKVLEQVGLGLWLKAQQKGLDTPLNELGSNLSAGERQLLCVARCLLQEAPIILMDEATSAMDPHTEKHLVHATQKLLANKTQLIVAHRTSTLERCKKIIWLEQGLIKDIASPSEIIPKLRQKLSEGDWA